MNQEENLLISAWDILVNRHGLACEKEYEPIFEQLEKTLEKSLLKRIKHIKKRCILLVGSDKDLIRKIACLLYYYSETLGFYYGDCLNEKSIEDTLSRFKRSTIFLEDLNTKDFPLIKRIAAKITNFLNADSRFHYKINGVVKTTPQGQLIVSISDTNNLPAYFRSQFDVIALEAKKRNLGKVSFDKVSLTINIDDKAFIFKDTKEYQLFEFLYENQHRDLKKDEIITELRMGIHAQQQVFNKITNVRKTIKLSCYKIVNKKEYDDRGGYRLSLK